MWTTALGRTERGGRESRHSTILRLAPGRGRDTYRHDERLPVPEELEEHLGDLPTDGES